MASLLTGCKSHDANLGQQVLGMWNRSEYDVPIRLDGSFMSWKSVPGHMTFLADGSYSSFYGDTNGFDKYSGTWFIKNGVLVLITTNSDGYATHDIFKLKIVQLNKQRFVYNTEPPKAVRITLTH
ncbi:MAG TPA: hypothetical protein VGO57_09175 [Verrucomicrobiae bacterium]